MKQKTQEQFELIAKYFELKDNLEMNEKVFDGIQLTYNVSLSPYPEVFTKLHDYFSNNKFDKFTSSTNEAELAELKSELIGHSDDLEAFAGKLESFEIKLKRYLQLNMKGVFYDEDIQRMKQIMKQVGEEQELVLEEADGESSDKEAKKEKQEKADEDSFEDDQVNFEDIAKTLDEKVKETARALAECLDAEQNKINDSIKKEIDRELGYVMEAGKDTEFLKKIEINDTKIDKLEGQIRELEKKEKTVKTKLHDFEKYFEESQKRSSAPTKSGQDIYRIEWIKRCDRVGNMRHYRSTSCLETYDRKPQMLEKLRRTRDIFRTITFIQELYLGKVEDYNFVARDYGEERLLLYNKLSTIFKTQDKFKKKEVLDKSELLGRLDHIPDKEVRKLISDMWKKNEAAEEAEADPYYSDMAPTEDFAKPTNAFQAAVKRIREQVLLEMQTLSECLKED